MKQPASSVRAYRLFGLTVISELDLPELLPALGVGEPDVTIRFGDIGGIAGRFGIEPSGEALVLTVPRIARYRITGGREILLDPEAEAPERNIRLYLLGSAFGVLLHQRGLLPLHANAVEIDSHAVAFMGASGAGKSTLAAWFHDRGHKVIADDICVVGFDPQNVPHVTPGLPRLRLWKEALEASGRAAADFDRAWEGSEEWDKYEVPLSAKRVAENERTLAAIFLLQSADEFEIKRLKGARAIQALIENTYRGRTIVAAAGPRLHWEACLRVAERIPVFELRRPWGLSRLDQDMIALLPQIRADAVRAAAR